MVTLTKIVSTQDAVLVAQYFYTLEAVQEVLLFGSVAERGRGEDIDLILIVSSEVAEVFMKYMENFSSGDLYQDKPSRSQRFYAVCRILGLKSVAEAFGWLIEEPSELLDIFLFPEDWSHNQRLATALYTTDRGGLNGFLDRIFEQFRRFDWQTGKFDSK